MAVAGSLSGVVQTWNVPASAQQANPVDKQTLQEVEGIVARLAEEQSQTTRRQAIRTSVTLVSQSGTAGTRRDADWEATSIALEYRTW